MYHVVLLLAIQGSADLVAQPRLVPIPAEEPPVQLGTPTPAPQRSLRPLVPAPGSTDVVLAWNEATLLAIKTENTPPPQATRNLAMVHGAVYDAINSILRTHTPYLVRESPPNVASPEAAAAVAGHRVLISLYPRQASLFTGVLNRTLQGIPAGPARDNGVAWGQQVAERMLAWRSRDGADRQVVYTPGNRVGDWQPTPPKYQAPLVPQWTQLTCFCMSSSFQFRPQGPPPLTSVEYARSLNQVKALGGIHSTQRTPEQTQIAWFWIGGEGSVTPPGQWNRIAQIVARAQGNTLEQNARLFALLNLALADAAISCWDCKYHFGFWRPIHAIWYADRDGNPDTHPDLTWTPLLPTPPFPSYTSGHSTFSSTAATVLACFFGTDAMPFDAQSDDLPGVTRSFASFSAAAREAGMSRIYGGIHYDFDNEDGLAVGRAIGEYVCRNYLLPTASSFPPSPPRGEGLGVGRNVPIYRFAQSRPSAKR